MKYRWILYMLITAGITACKDEENKQQQNNNEAAHTAQVKQLQQAVQAYPDSAGLRLQLIDILDSIGDYKTAFIHLDSLLAKDSANYGLWYRKGMLAQVSGDTARAVSAFEKAVTVYQAPEALLSLANLYAEKKDERALQLAALIQRMRLDRETEAHSFFIAGVYFARKGEGYKAIELFNRCVTLNYTYMEAYIEKGMVYFDRNEYKAALEVFRFASSINNLYPDAYYYMARCYEMMNQKDSAELRFRQSLTLDKNLTEARRGLQRLGAE